MRISSIPSKKNPGFLPCFSKAQKGTPTHISFRLLELLCDFSHGGVLGVHFLLEIQHIDTKNGKFERLAPFTNWYLNVFVGGSPFKFQKSKVDIGPWFN